MIEINWSEIDPKYRYCAVDDGGEMYLYLDGDKPFIDDDMLLWCCEGENFYLGWTDEPTPDWRESLQERPTK